MLQKRPPGDQTEIQVDFEGDFQKAAPPDVIGSISPSLHPIEAPVTTFLRDLESIYSSAPTSLLAISSVHGLANHNLYKLAESAGLIEADGPHDISRDTARRLNKARNRTEILARAALIAPRTFLVSTASQFDVFLARLIRALVEFRSDILSASERGISYSELVTFDSVANARESILEAEIESVLWKGLSDQFLWFETKFDVKLRTDLPVRKELIELTQRRNLFVHADGINSKQYFTVCENNQVDTSHSVIGTPLHIDPVYLLRARDVLTEASVKLSQVLWRKADQASLLAADQHLNGFAYEALQSGRYDMASNLLDFAFMKPMKRANKELELMLTVNRANAYKLAGDSLKYIDLLGNEDCSAYDKQFRLARAVLLGEQSEMVRLMKDIGAAGAPSIDSYGEWPLFAHVQDTPAFINAFRLVFGEDFVVAPPLVVDATVGVEAIDIQMNAKDFLTAITGVSKDGDMHIWLREFMKLHHTNN